MEGDLLAMEGRGVDNSHARVIVKGAVQHVMEGDN